MITCLYYLDNINMKITIEFEDFNLSLTIRNFSDIIYSYKKIREYKKEKNHNYVYIYLHINPFTKFLFNFERYDNGTFQSYLKIINHTFSYFKFKNEHILLIREKIINHYVKERGISLNTGYLNFLFTCLDNHFYDMYYAKDSYSFKY